MTTNRFFTIRTIDLPASENATARRRQSLVALLAIYVAGLTLVVALPEGADVGCILGGMFAHVVYVTVRSTVASVRERSALLLLGKRGLLVVGNQLRRIRYSEIHRTERTDQGLTLALRDRDIRVAGLGRMDASNVIDQIRLERLARHVRRTNAAKAPFASSAMMSVPSLSAF